jgi:hypothetical protein
MVGAVLPPTLSALQWRPLSALRAGGFQGLKIFVTVDGRISRISRGSKTQSVFSGAPEAFSRRMVPSKCSVSAVPQVVRRTHACAPYGTGPACTRGTSSSGTARGWPGAPG